jgi:molecular chaperone GrpE
MADKNPNSGDAENAEEGQNLVSPEAIAESDQQFDPGPPAAEDPIAVFTEKVVAAETAAQENHDRFLRVSAEFDNYKKRCAKETSDFRKFANESLLKELLHVVDNLERALETCDATGGASAIREGVVLTLKDLIKVMDKFSVEAVDALGKPFDPTFHQAVMQEPSATEPDNTVIRQLQKGYTLHGRLLRPAMVVVTKAIAEPPDDILEDKRA